MCIRDRVYTVSPVTTDFAGFTINAPVIGETITAKPDSMADTNRKAMLKAAYNADTEAQVDKARKAKQAAYDGVVNAMADVDNSHLDGNVPTVITRAGTTIDTTAHIPNREVKPLTHVEAAMQIRGILGDGWTAEHYKAVQAQYPNGVPATAIDEIIDRIRQGEPINYLKVVNQWAN